MRKIQLPLRAGRAPCQYPRSTPYDQDYLRKLARTTRPQELERWYNQHVAALYKELDAYDAEGIFIADRSYLFVPDNAHYEGSMRLLFDEHNHPVGKEQQKKLTQAQRDRCHWRRCYRALFLLHCDRAGDRFVVAGLRVLRADQSEVTALWPLLDTFFEHVGEGVMKVLVVDRGFIDGPHMGLLKTNHHVDTVIPIRSNMDILEDVRGLTQLTTHWEEYEATHRAPLEAPHPLHPTARKRERTRQKTLARKQAEKPPADPSDIRERTLIARFPDLTSWSDCPVPLTGVLSKDVYADGHEKSWLLVNTDRQATARGTRDLYRLRTDIEERHRQIKCFWDLTRFHSTAWNLIVSQAVFVCLTYSLLQIHLLHQGHEELNRRTCDTTRRLLPDGDRVIVYRQQCFAFFTLLEHMEMTLKLEGKARRKALAKIRRLQQDVPVSDPGHHAGP